MDRVYLNTPNVVAVLDHERKRTYVVRKEGLPDVGKLNSYLVKGCLRFPLGKLISVMNT